MKKILLVALLSSVISTGAFAVTACGTATQITTAGDATTGASGNECVCGGLLSGKTNYAGGSGTSVVTPKFVKTGFIVQCSANTFVSLNEVSGTFLSVGSVSVKGNQIMGGHTAGGAVNVLTGTNSGKCAAATCAGGDADTANTASTTAGSSL